MPDEKQKIQIEVRLSLSDDVAREATAQGLLEPSSLESLLRQELRRRRVDRLFEAADRLAGLAEPPLTEEEVEEEIRAVRAGHAAHAGGR